MKINGAADDASGYAISERMRVQIRGLDQANANTQNGNAMMKVAEGAVSSTVDILKTLKEKVINAANDTNTDADRQTIQKELDQSIDQIDDNANITYNGKYLVDGSHNNKVQLTHTHLTNESFGKDQTAQTALTELTNRTGDKLNIQVGDQLTVSYVKNGKTFSTSMKVEAGTKLSSILDLKGANGAEKDGSTIDGVLSFENASTATSKIGTDAWQNPVFTADKGFAITIKAVNSGVNGKIAGFTLSITNNKGKIKKSGKA
jgi:flagellin